MRNWPVAGETIGDEVPDVAVAPPHSSVLGGQNLAIAAGTKRPRAAQALIQFFTNAASQQILSEVGGFVPTRQSALTYAKRPDAQYIQAALNNARLRVVDPQYVRFSQVFRQCAFSALNNNGKLPDGCAAELARTLQ
jgi:multiple sugar transport system substrate-binding protein